MNKPWGNQTGMNIGTLANAKFTGQIQVTKKSYPISGFQGFGPLTIDIVDYTITL